MVQMRDDLIDSVLYICESILIRYHRYRSKICITQLWNGKHDNMQENIFIIMVFKNVEAISMRFDTMYKMLNSEKRDICWNFKVLKLVIWCRNNSVDIIKIDTTSCLEQSSMVRVRMTHEIHKHWSNVTNGDSKVLYFGYFLCSHYM